MDLQAPQSSGKTKAQNKAVGPLPTELVTRRTAPREITKRGAQFKQSPATGAETPPGQAEVATVTVAPSDEQSVPIDISSHVQSPTSEVAALAQTLDDTVEYLERFIKFPMVEQAYVVALWVAHTYVFKAWEYTPYLHILSPEKNCGKTNLLKLLQYVCANPLKFESSSTSAFFHKVDELHPTLLWDECDNFSRTRKTTAS